MKHRLRFVPLPFVVRAAVNCLRTQLMCSVTVVEWLWLPLLPVIVNVALVPETPLRVTLMLSVEVPGLLAGFGLKLALV